MASNEYIKKQNSKGSINTTNMPKEGLEDRGERFLK